MLQTRYFKQVPSQVNAGKEVSTENWKTRTGKPWFGDCIPGSFILIMEARAHAPHKGSLQWSCSAVIPKLGVEFQVSFGSISR